MGSSSVRGPMVEVNDINERLRGGEDPLAGDQNDHDMDSIAGVLKLYFRAWTRLCFQRKSSMTSSPAFPWRACRSELST
ncbi:hypothetical protein WMY93_031455 [Mugilogobius chulae]|uniref:Uncharacterized protein n=1 Tax=Mugilogobius chulae TaxID=88201 RepID=A0AAW0MMA7_9GOBI